MNIESKRTVWGAIASAVATVGISVGAFRGHSESTNQTVSTQNSVSAQTASIDLEITFEVASQPDSPLQMGNLVNNSINSDVLELTFTISNVGITPISAYTIKHLDVCGASETGGFETHNILSKENILQPGKSIVDTLSASGCSGVIKSVTLSVDFAEFVDGKNWGEDLSKSAERLAGTRAGALDETTGLDSLIKTKGYSAIPGLALNESKVLIPPNHSEAWIKGYLSGRKSRLRQIQQAFSEGGEERTRTRLRMSYDAAGKEDR